MLWHKYVRSWETTASQSKTSIDFWSETAGKGVVSREKIHTKAWYEIIESMKPHGMSRELQVLWCGWNKEVAEDEARKSRLGWDI